MSGNLASVLVRTAREHGERTAYKLDDAALSWREVDDASARVAALLRARGLAPGDRVGLMLPNVPHFPIAYFGILRAGGVVVPVNVLLRSGEIAYHLQDSGARLLLAWHGFAEEAGPAAAAAGAELVTVAPGELEALLAAATPLTEVAPRDPGDTAVILYTSGTTGTPKGAELTHDNLERNARVSLETLLGMGGDDVMLGALPLFHSFGQTVGQNCCALAGATLTLLPRFDPGKALEIVQRDRVTVFAGVPTMYAALLHHPDRDAFDASSLRLCVSGGAAMPVEVMHAFEEAFGCVILEGYGLSETSPVASFNHPGRPRKPGSIGTPIRGVEMRVVDDAGAEVAPGEVGEIVVRGHNVMRGYWERPQDTREAMRDGWFHTGDMARVDDDGYFFIVDRKKDLIIRGGFNVYPREVEEVLYQHPDVVEAAVVGMPHPELGEEVGAAVAVRPDASVTPEDLQAFVRDQLAAFKCPRRVWFVAQLPKTATGKILKREIEVPHPVAAS